MIKYLSLSLKEIRLGEKNIYSLLKIDGKFDKMP